MSNNLDLDQVAAAQDNKETTINDQSGQLDAAITEFLDVDLTAGNVTVTADEYRRNLRFNATNVATTGREVTLQAIKHVVVLASDSGNTDDVTFQIGTGTLVLSPGDVTLAYSDGTANGLEAVAGDGSIVVPIYMHARAVEKTTDLTVATDITGNIVSPVTGTIADVKAVVDTAGVTGDTVIDVNLNGTTIMTADKITIETTETDSDDAATQPALTTTAISANDLLAIDVDSISTTPPKGLVVLVTIDRTV